LRPDDAVHHLRAHGLESLGPVDVGLLVEARLQLDHAGHFLAAPRRLDQQFHQHRLGAGAVDGLLDGQHLGVVDRLAQELHHRGEALERVVQQQVAAAAALEDRHPRRQAPLRRPGRLVGAKRSSSALAWSISWSGAPG
jgi:hypothetical protein